MRYGIKDTRSMEILVDNLTFKKAIETLKIYQDFFGDNNIVMTVCGTDHNQCAHTTMKEEYKNEYINYFAQLQKMGNLL